MVYDSLGELETALPDELLERGRFMRNPQPTQGRLHLVVMIDDGYVSGTERTDQRAGLDSVTVLDLTAPQTGLAVRRGLQLVVGDGRDRRAHRAARWRSSRAADRGEPGGGGNLRARDWPATASPPPRRSSASARTSPATPA